MHRTLIIILFAVLTSVTAFGQTSYKGITPGKSTKAEVERVFGQPVTKVSATLIEYAPLPSSNPPLPAASKVYVQYRRDSSIVERIEPNYADFLAREPVLRLLRLPLRPTASQINSKGRLEEYFSTASVVLTYVGADAASGVSRVGYYSPELFESAAAKVTSGQQNPQPPATSGGDGLGRKEDNTALDGTNLTYYPQPSIDQCESDCANNANCKGFTWIKAGTYNPGDSAMCYLLSAVTRKTPARGHISAVKGRR